jgi:hypothetical protein
MIVSVPADAPGVPAGTAVMRETTEEPGAGALAETIGELPDDPLALGAEPLNRVTVTCPATPVASWASVGAFASLTSAAAAVSTVSGVSPAPVVGSAAAPQPAIRARMAMHDIVPISLLEVE